MKKILPISLFILTLFSGCVMERMAKNPKFKNKVCQACSGRDTFNTVIRDTLIETETDTAWQTIELGCDSLGQAQRPHSFAARHIRLR